MNHWMKAEKLGWKSFTVQSMIIMGFTVFGLSIFFAYVASPASFGTFGERFADLSYRAASTPAVLLIILGMPLLSALLRIGLNQRSLTLKDEILLVADVAMIVLVMLLYPAVAQGPLRFVSDQGFGVGVSVQLNMLAYMFVLLSVVVWFFVMMFAHEYMKKEDHNRRFFLFLSLSYTATLGIFIAGDLLTLFFAYEMLTIMTYLLVAHHQSKDSIEAANEYLFMGILGGFSIFVAMVLIYTETGSFMFDQSYQLLAIPGATPYLILGLLIIGFGVKAGMFPLHVWLPKAHPVAPSPASSLLSGIMIKVGVFGLLQSLIYFYFPVEVWSDSTGVLGQVLLWIGLVTMALGVVFAIVQSDIKKLLAYSSVSQIGYIFLGLGLMMILQDKGGVALSGALYHMVNHALFKSLLFMVAGLIILRTHERNMYKLGGLARHLPITAAISLIASLAIAGMPLFNGFVSKTVLHHAITESITYKSNLYMVVDWLFIAISAGTVAYFIKFNYFIFFGPENAMYKDLQVKRRSVYLPMIVMALGLLMIGLFPNFLVETFIQPVALGLPFDASFTVAGLDFNYFAGKELLLTLGIWAGGFAIFFGLKAKQLLTYSFPDWLHLEFLLLYPISALMHGLLLLIDSDHETMDKATYQTYRMSNYKLTFKDHLVVFSDILNQKYEGLIIKSDAFIYTLFLTAVVIVMGVLSFIL